MSFARPLFQSSNEAGPIGPTGPPGPAGPAVAPAGGAVSIGATGPAGAIGPAGLQGPAGPAGVAGSVGAIGPAGSPGSVGPAGSPGSTGPAGLPGSPGSTGPVGLPGSPGAAGAVGLPGSIGATGLPGSPGTVGSTGATGSIGATGPAGSAAAIGATGSIGPTGPAGGGSGSGSNTSLAVNYYLPVYDATQQEYYRFDLARINMSESIANVQIKYNLNISIPFNILGDSQNYQFWDSGEVFFSGRQAGAGPGFNTNDSTPYYTNNLNKKNDPNNGLCYMNRYIGGVNPGPLYDPANVNTQMGTLWFEYIPSNSYITCWFWSSPDYWVKSDKTTPYQQSVICNLNLQILNDGNATLPTTNYINPPAGMNPADPGLPYVVSLSPAGGIVNSGYTP